MDGERERPRTTQRWQDEDNFLPLPVLYIPLQLRVATTRDRLCIAYSLHGAHILFQMHHDLSSGLAQSDLTIPYHHNDSGPLAGIKKKDAQVFVGEVIATFLLCFLVACTKVTQHNGMLSQLT